MKKTIIALLALGGVAAADSEISLDSAVIYHADSLTSSYTLGDTEKFSGDFSLSLTLDVDAVKDLIGNTSAPNAYFTIANVHATTQGNAGIIFQAKKDSDDNHYLAVGVTTDSVSSEVQSSPNWSRDYTGLTDVNWDSVTCAAITLTHTSTSRSDYYLTVIDSDGVSSTYSGGGENLRWSGGFSTIDKVSLSTDYVQSVALFASALSSTEVASIHSQLIPEPSTITLSLLSLAGLAARRRRK